MSVLLSPSSRGLMSRLGSVCVSVTPPLRLFQGKMIMQDKLEKERNDAKNNVEEYVYEMRDKLHGVLEKFVNEAVSRDHTRGMKMEIKHMGCDEL